MAATRPCSVRTTLSRPMLREMRLLALFNGSMERGSVLETSQGALNDVWMSRLLCDALEAAQRRLRAVQFNV
jgi:hypothetical protein